jgi:tripartite-type tricarboxylate transporter receptor subunit TctC
MTPRGVPADRLARLEASILKAFQAPAFLAYCRTAGIDVDILDAEGFRRFVAAESDRFARIVREEGLVPA